MIKVKSMKKTEPSGARYWVRLRPYALYCVVLTLAGCSGSQIIPSPTRPLRAVDNGVSLPTLRLGHTFNADSQAPTLQSGHGMEVNLSQTSGRDNQFIDAGQDVRAVDSEIFFGPQRIEHEFNFDFYDASYRWRYFDGNFGWEGLAGLSHTSLQLQATSATQRAAETLSSYGAALGLGGIWRLRPATSLQARYTTFEPIGNELDAERFEVFVVWTFTPKVAIRAGYATWNVSARQDSPREIDMDFSGPSLGFDFEF